MYSQNYANLHRQFKALALLESLLEEEYDLLQQRDAESIMHLEFSIHELLRQIAVERLELKNRMQGVKLEEYAAMLPDEQHLAIKRILALIDSLEQRCARDASRNAELSLALYDQSHALLHFLHEKLSPKSTDLYSAGGKMQQTRPSAALISGRL